MLLLCISIIVLVLALFIVNISAIREQANTSVCQGRLKQLGAALVSYRKFFGIYPPTYISDHNNRPLHSWRILILPFIEKEEIYLQYDFCEPWDCENNARIANIDRVSGGSIFRCPSDTESPSLWTNYVIPFYRNNRKDWKDICCTDAGWEDKILIVEMVKSGIHWMEPRDINCEQLVNGKFGEREHSLSSNHVKGINYVTFRNELGILPRTYDLQFIKNKTLYEIGEIDRELLVKRHDDRVRELVRYLNDPSDLRRHGAALILSQLGVKSKCAIDGLRAALQDKNEKVRQAVFFAINRIDKAIEVNHR